TTQELSEDNIDIPIVENKLGKFGALLANQFIYEWFGVASFLFILILFVIGYKFLYRRSILPVWKTLIYTLSSIILLSITFGFIQDFISKTPHILEGKFGYWTNQILKAQIGTVGTGGILIFIVLTLLVIVYNLDLQFSLKSNRESDELQEELLEEEDEYQSTLQNSRINQTRNEVVSHTYEQTAQPDFTESTAPENKVEFNTNEPNTVSLPLASNTVKANKINERQEKEIELSIEQSPEPEIIDDTPESPNLVVEKVIEEKPITSNDLVEKFGQYDPKLDLSGYQYPGLDLLKDYGTGKITINQQELEGNKNRIVETLRHYNIEIEHIKATIGPTVTLYEIIPKPGVRISKIKNLEDDIALSLAALGIRIIAPMPGKGTIGIEVPSSTPEMVSMRSILATEKYQKTDMDLPIALGKTISNEVYIA
ncbi:MAG: DNA translocase FtsK 4TM domain-containing protein, partial [Sphingobacterium sp.]